MPTVEVRPHVGQQRNDAGEIADDVDTGIDCVYLVSAEWPTPKRVGYVGRDPGSPVNLICTVAESDIASIREAVAARDGIESDHIRINQVPEIATEEKAKKGLWGKKK
jgi:hypothetical protein